MYILFVKNRSDSCIVSCVDVAQNRHLLTSVFENVFLAKRFDPTNDVNIFRLERDSSKVDNTEVLNINIEHWSTFPKPFLPPEAQSKRSTGSTFKRPRVR